MKPPFKAAIVLFVQGEGAIPGITRPAIVTEADPKTLTVNVKVFPDGNKELGDRMGQAYWRRGVHYDPNGTTHNTWHWPEDAVTATESRRHD